LHWFHCSTRDDAWCISLSRTVTTDYTRVLFADEYSAGFIAVHVRLLGAPG